MTRRERELSAAVLGDRPPSPVLKRWLATDEGRREFAAHRRALGALRELYGGRAVASPSAAKPIHYTSLAADVAAGRDGSRHAGGRGGYHGRGA